MRNPGWVDLLLYTGYGQRVNKENPRHDSPRPSALPQTGGFGRTRRVGSDDALYRVVDRYFTHPAHWKIDGCPYFSIYNLGTLDGRIVGQHPRQSDALLQRLPLLRRRTTSGATAAGPASRTRLLKRRHEFVFASRPVVHGDRNDAVLRASARGRYVTNQRPRPPCIASLPCSATDRGTDRRTRLDCPGLRGPRSPWELHPRPA